MCAATAFCAAARPCSTPNRVAGAVPRAVQPLHAAHPLARRAANLAARGAGQDAVKGWLDLASFVSSAGSSGGRTPYDELADKIGRDVYLDLQGWHLYTKDVKLGQGLSLAQALAAQLGPQLQSGSFRPADLDALLKKVPIKLGGGKVTVALADVVPTGCVRDFERLCEDYARDLKQNEDRYQLEVAEGPVEEGIPVVYAGVFDGHGGNATAEWLANNLLDYVEKYWEGTAAPERAISEAFIQADKKILAPKPGFMGLVGERGVGGSKCGSTAAVAMIYNDRGTSKLLTANCGDARVILVRGGQAIVLTEDHVPDNEEERDRIEKYNPNPRLPLVRYVGGTWRLGGLLALSRAFGDAHMGNDQFEGVSYYASDTYASGFGLIAEPYTTLTDLTSEDAWLVISSDGLLENEERGGGGGLSNEDVVTICSSMASKSCDAIAAELGKRAVDQGSTDDVTVVVLKLK